MSKSTDKLKDIAFYVVMNSDGQFFRRKGYGGYGKTWVDEPATARIYVKIGQARSIVTFFANAYPQYPAPSIVKLGVGAIEIIDETDRVKKAKEKKARDKANQDLRDKKYRLQQAEADLARAQQNVTKAGAALSAAKKGKK